MTAPSLVVAPSVLLRRSAVLCHFSSSPSPSPSATFSTSSLLASSPSPHLTSSTRLNLSDDASSQPLARVRILDTRAEKHVTSSSTSSREVPPLAPGADRVEETEKSRMPEELPRPSRGRVEEEEETPYPDEINTLMRHPALYDPVLKPRFPIVLCHGLYGFDVRGPTFFRLHYWGDLLKILRGKVGAEVFVTAVPGTGAVKDRARVLHEALEATEGIKGQDLNFLAHSMGGLDARYLFSNIQPQSYHPRSLTTVSTPHRGSEFMSWCRANIGIGTDFDKTSEVAARIAHQEPEIDKLLPFSLKSPLLTRGNVVASSSSSSDSSSSAKKAKEDQAQEEQDAWKRAAKAEAAKVKANVSSGSTSLPLPLPSSLAGGLGALPSSLTTSISSYLLDLLDSPAYGNLTPSFLRDVFNPGTPDRPDVRYFSVAARTDKISIWHPLWLPKMVLDGAEAARVAQGTANRDGRWRGNDGLVNVESAKWGEFLGTLEGADHWEVRGSSGLINAVESAKAIAEATNIAGSVDGGGGEGKKKEEGKKNGWSWQDVYRLVGNSRDKNGKEKAEVVKAPPSSSTATTTTTTAKEGKKDDEKSLTAVAGWIIDSLPGVGSSSSASATPFEPAISKPGPNGELSHTARMLYGAPTSSSSSASTPPNPSATAKASGAPPPTAAKRKPDKFDLERLTLALCRKLYNEGL